MSSRKASLAASLSKLRHNQDKLDVLSQTASQQSKLLLQNKDDLRETNKDWLKSINDKLGLKKEFRIVQGTGTKDRNKTMGLRYFYDRNHSQDRGIDQEKE